MLRIPIQKDPEEYQPKIFWRLTKRTLLSFIFGIGSSILTMCYFQFVLHASSSFDTFITYSISIPFWLFGFWTPAGMPFEKWLPAWIRHHLSSGRLMYIPSPAKAGLTTDLKGGKYGPAQRAFTKISGREAYCPTAGRVGIERDNPRGPGDK